MRTHHNTSCFSNCRALSSKLLLAGLPSQAVDAWCCLARCSWVLRPVPDR